MKPAAMATKLSRISMHIAQVHLYKAVMRDVLITFDEAPPDISLRGTSPMTQLGWAATTCVPDQR